MRVQEPVAGGGGAGLGLGGGVGEVEADAVVEQDGTAVGRREREHGVHQDAVRGGGRCLVGVLVGAAEPVPGGEGVLVRGGAHPADGVGIGGHLGPPRPGELERPLDGLLGEPAAAGEQVRLPGERGGGVLVQRVEHLPGPQRPHRSPALRNLRLPLRPARRLGLGCVVPFGRRPARQLCRRSGVGCGGPFGRALGPLRVGGVREGGS